MKDFAALYAELDARASTAAKLQALKQYLARADYGPAAKRDSPAGCRLLLLLGPVSLG